MVAQVMWALFGWIFLWPLTWVIPRKSQHIVIIGRDGGKFLDNAKHLFVGLQFPEFEHFSITFLTDRVDVQEALLKSNCLVAPLKGLKGLLVLLRCEMCFVDSLDWAWHGRFATLRGAKVIQLWHGIPLKRIELMVAEQIAEKLSVIGRSAFWMYRAFVVRHYRFDVLLTTSKMVARDAMTRCFNSKQCIAIGYPRNDVLQNDSLRQKPLMKVGVDAQAWNIVDQAVIKGQHVVLYAPTFRTGFPNPFSAGVIDLAALDAFLQSHQAIILIKLHPWMQLHEEKRQRYQRICFVESDSDIYPILPSVDVLITDYSSVYFDFLLLDRPIIFFCYDLDSYLTEDRGFIFDFESMTPGTKVKTQHALHAELATVIAGKDSHHIWREQVRTAVFDFKAGSASHRLIAALSVDE